MSSLFSILSSAASSMTVFENAMAVTQNNVSNASTAGYADQVATFDALPFNLGKGNVGGVAAGPIESTRDEYLEQSVRDTSTALGSYNQQVTALSSLQNYFDVSGKTGVPAALSNLYSAFSSWSTNPTNPSSQQNVLTQAQDVAAAFNSTASNVAQVATNTDNQLGNLVDQVNTLVGQLKGYNAQIEQGDKNDPGLQASVYSALQNLSQLVNVTTTTQPDGSYSVMLGTGTLLLAGTTQNSLSMNSSVSLGATNPLGPPDVTITDSRGSDVTDNITGGEVGGLLYVRNQVLPSIQGDGSQDGSLNQMAKSLANQVNTLLGYPLFSYDQSNGTNTAASLAVNSNFTLSDLPAARVTALTGTDLTSSLAIVAGINDSLNLEVDGKTLPAITLKPSDTTASDVAKDLNGQFSSLGLGAQASVNGEGGLVLSTTNTGSSGSIAILNGTANATLGLSSTTPTYSNDSSSVALTLANLLNDAGSGQVTTLSGSSMGASVSITTGTNDALNLEVDGKALPTLTLKPADTSASAVAADLNAQFTKLGVGATAIATSNGGLALSTTNTSSGSIAILSGSAKATLGLTDITPTYQTGLNGMSFTSYFGSIASGVGTALATATTGQTAEQNALTQNESLRQQISGVNLNTEATNLLQFQNAYDAASKMISVINNLTTTVLNEIGSAVS